MKNHPLVKTIFCGFLIALLIFLTVVTTFAGMLQLHIFSTKGFNSAISQSNYANGLKKTLQTSFEDLLIPTGLPPEAAKYALNENTFSTDFQIILSDVFSETNHFSAASFQEKCRSGLITYCHENGYDEAEGFEEALEGIVDALTEEYANTMSIRFSSYYLLASASLNTALPWLCVSLIVVLAAVLLSLFRLYTRRHVRYKLLYYWTFSSALLLGVPAAILRFSGYLGSLAITPAYAKSFYMALANSFLNGLLLVAVVLLLFAVLFLVRYFMLSRKLYRSSH